MDRIQRLERSRPVEVATVASPMPKIIATLTAAGFNRGDNESWAEVWARAMGITVGELRVDLLRRSQAA